MKITSIEATALRSSAETQRTSTQEIKNRQSCIVQIHTDDGLVGIGDAQRPENPEAMCYLVKDFSQLLIGRDPLEWNILWDLLYSNQRTRGRTKGFTVEAISAIDIAIWDLVSKATRQPIFNLLGGKFHSRLRAYATKVMLGITPEKRLEQAAHFIESGFKAIKVAVGIQLEDDLEFIGQLRDRFGYDLCIALDANCSLSFKRAVWFSRSLEKYDIHWLEEPMPPEYLDDYIDLRRNSSIPIAAGESEFTVFGFKDWISKGALDIIQPDVGRAGGITQLKKIADMAETFDLEFSPHTGHGSALTYAATLQVVASAKNFGMFELEQLDNPIREKLARKRIDIQREGYLEVGDPLGIGVDLDLDFLKSHTTLNLLAR